MKKSKTNAEVRIPKCPRCGSEDISFLYENVVSKKRLYLIISIFFLYAAVFLTISYEHTNEGITTISANPNPGTCFMLLISWITFYIYKRNHSSYVEDVTYIVCNVCGHKVFWEYPARDKRRHRAKIYTLIYIIITIIIVIAISFV